MSLNLKGAVPVLVMPFNTDGTVDEESLIRQIDFCVEAGLRERGLTASGTRDVTVLGGSNGNLLPEELERGAVGTLPFAAIIDAYRTVCDHYATGDATGICVSSFRCCEQQSQAAVVPRRSGYRKRSSTGRASCVPPTVVSMSIRYTTGSWNVCGGI